MLARRKVALWLPVGLGLLGWTSVTAGDQWLLLRGYDVNLFQASTEVLAIHR